MSLISILRESTKAVPFVKYAFGIAGIAAVVALVKSFNIDFRVGLVGTIIVLVLMFVLFLMVKASQNKASFFHGPSKFLVWAILLLFIFTSSLLVACVFFSYPKDLSVWIQPKEPREFSFTVYLYERSSSRNLDLSAGGLALRCGDKNFDAKRIGEGTYRFFDLPAVVRTSIGKIRIVNQSKYVFENNSYDDTIALTTSSKDCFVKKDTGYLQLKGTLTLNKKPLSNVKVLVKENPYLFSYSDSLGQYKIALPQNEDRERVSITILRKGSGIQNFECVLGKYNDFELGIK